MRERKTAKGQQRTWKIKCYWKSFDTFLICVDVIQAVDEIDEPRREVIGRRVRIE